ncbi:ATP-dependent DNA helicase [Wenzhouxiangella sp. XN24]|uniref:ATP-dependent DNA helicase n=1 Tax=Wenzhouxiangella sp. XN24 TaxID=2713569 RepID=UPI003211EF37
MNAIDIGAAFDADGILQSSLEGFRPREGQRRMAEAVAEALATRSILLVEAGTGTGKTYAYLAPVLAAGLKVVVSTGTKTLQDQLFRRDLPALSGALGRPVHVALLKGRSNYLCRHRLELALDEGPGVIRETARLAKIQAWSGITTRGEIAEVPGIPEDAPVWGRVTSNADNCLGQECPEFQRCHVVKARREALKADVVVVNHHLLLADLALKEEGFGELLPGADAVVVDEAHQLPEIAARFFGVSAGTRQALGLVADTRAEALKAGAWQASLEADVDALERAARDAAALLAGAGGRISWPELPSSSDTALAALEDAAAALADACETLGGASAGLDAVERRARAFATRLGTVREGGGGFELRWAETGRRSASFHAAPVDAGRALAAQINARECGWVFTSATLAVGDDFGAFLDRLGLEEAETLRLDSPFDFRARTRLYIPEGLPAPSDPDYTRRVVDIATPLLEASGGRAFLLFTSHRALQAAARLLRPRAAELGFPVLVQGDEPRAHLLASFRRLGNAVLLGTQSFWEGVDVKGPALSVVLIDKLPFAAPDDPLLKARLEAAREAGREPFRDVQLPQAVLTLKQGIGRLIRDVDDAGLAVVCDPRLLGKGYGRVFLVSLPPMPIVRKADEAVDFLLGLGLTTLEDAG